MPEDSKEIEVEVVEIDGVAPAIRPEPVSDGRRDGRHWQGRVRRLDSRWWPLWVILGSILLVLALTVGVFVGVVLLIIRIFLTLVRAVLK